VPVQKGWKTKTWKNFLKLISESLSLVPKGEKNIICGYISFLNSVISVLEVEQMDFSKIESLYYFNNCLTDIGKEITVVSLLEYKTTSAFQVDKFGKYFYFNNSQNKPVYFWIGLYIADYAAIYFMINHYKNESWCPKKTAETVEKLENGKYFDKTVVDDGALWVPLKDDYYNKFCSDTKVEEQKQILKEFLDEILKKIL
jgi:hypothetical protein